MEWDEQTLDNIREVVLALSRPQRILENLMPSQARANAVELLWRCNGVRAGHGSGKHPFAKDATADKVRACLACILAGKSLTETAFDHGMKHQALQMLVNKAAAAGWPAAVVVENRRKRCAEQRLSAKRPAPKRKRLGLTGWLCTDWTQSDEVLSALYGCSVSCVRSNRRIHAPETHTRFRGTWKVDWDKLDWTKDDLDLATELGVLRTTVQRRRVWHDPARKIARD